MLSMRRGSRCAPKWLCWKSSWPLPRDPLRFHAPMRNRSRASTSKARSRVAAWAWSKTKLSWRLVLGSTALMMGTSCTMMRLLVAACVRCVSVEVHGAGV